MKTTLFALLGLSCCLFITACASVQNQSANQKAICKELKERIIFNAATSDTRQAEIDSAEQPRLMNAYEKQCTN